MSHVATAPHEVRGHLLWDEHGVSPYWALHSLVQASDGGGTYEVTVDGEDLTVTLGYDPEGISPRPQDDVDRIYAYNVFWQTEDGLRFGGSLKPRFEPDEFRQYQPDQPFHQRDTITVPKDLGEAVAYHITAGKYREPDYYAQMLPKIVTALALEISVGWNSEYLTGDPHRYSSIYQHERTVRYSRDAATKVTRRGGILHRLFELLADVDGVSFEYKVDDTEIEGYHHELRLDPAAVDALFPAGGRVGVTIKSYHPREARSNDSENDPLYHPRFGVIFRQSHNDGSSVPYYEHPDLVRELEELTVNVLEWAGITVEPDPTTYISDPYWDVEESYQTVGFYADPTPKIEHTQNQILLDAFTHATDTDLEILEQLLADRGAAHYEKLESKTGRAVSTLYRSIERLDGLIETSNGIFQFISEKIRQDIEEILRPLQEQILTRADAIAHLLDIDRQRLRQEGSALQKWLTKYAVELDETDEVSLTIKATVDRLRSTSVPMLNEVLLEGLRAWRDAGLDPIDYRNARVQWVDSTGQTNHGFVTSILR